MTWLTHLKLGLAAVGVVLWGVGYRGDDERLRWIGIAFLAAAALLRFVKSRSHKESSGT